MTKKNANKVPFGSGMAISQDQLADMIRKEAYELYEKRGKKQDRDMDNWLEAERIIKQRV